MIKDGKIFGKINIFDFIVLVLVIILAFGAFFFFGIKAVTDKELTKKSTLKEINYDIVLESVRMETVETFEIAQPIYDADSMLQIGIVSSIETEDAKVPMETFDGKIVNAPVEDKYKLTLTMKAIVNQIEEGDMWITTSNRFLEGRTLTFVTQKNRCQGPIRNVRIVEDLGPLNIKFNAARDDYYDIEKDEESEVE